MGQASRRAIAPRDAGPFQRSEGAMRARIHSAIGGVCLIGFTWGCGSQPIGEFDDRVGSLRAAVEIGPSTHDVAQVRFDLVAADSGCDASALATLTVPV